MIIKNLEVFDFDGTLFQTPEPDMGKKIWSEYYGKEFPYLGWWGRSESLDLDVFNIKPISSVVNQLKGATKKPNTYVIVLTSRIEKLRPYIQKILDMNDITVDYLDMRRKEFDKGIKILRYVGKFSDLESINVYDDREVEITSYENIKKEIPNNISFNIYKITNGSIVLSESNYTLVEIIKEEIMKLKR